MGGPAAAGPPAAWRRSCVPALTSTIVEKITGAPAHTYAQWSGGYADDFR